MGDFFKAYKKYIIHQIKRGKGGEYQPTYRIFNASALYDAHKEVNMPFTEQDVDDVVDFVEVSKYYNKLQNNICALIEQNLYPLNLRGCEIAQYLVAFFNQQYRVAVDLQNESLQSSMTKGAFFYDIMNPQIESLDPSIGPISIRGSLELQTDSLNFILNKVLRDKLNKRFENSEADETIFSDTLKGIYLCPQPSMDFMSSYEDILYNEGYVKRDIEKKLFVFDYESHNDLKLLKAGDIIFHDKFMLELLYRTRGLPNKFHKRISGYRIKRVSVENGVIALKFAQNEAKEHKLVANTIKAAIDSFYEFLDGSTSLPLFDNATVDEAVSVLVAIRYIIGVVFSTMKCDKDLKMKSDFDEIPCKIRIYDLVDYIARLTTINKKKIKLVVNAMMSDLESSKPQFIWPAPLYKIGEYSLIPFYPSLNASLYYLIDVLLKKGGSKLEDRGKIFERFLYKKLTNMKTTYPIYCLPDGKYGKKNKEEIDLIISTKNSIFVGEAKCIHYSVEPREFSEARERLVKGCEQAKRKALFIEENLDFFIEKFPELGDYSDKEVVPFVVTNYPTFTGFNHNGVYIIDADNLVGYFNIGKLSNHNLSPKGDSQTDIIIFYDSEDEFSDNFSNYLAHNPLKEMHSKRIVIEDQQLIPDIDILQLMPDMEGWKAISKSAQINHDEQIIIRNK